MPMNEMQKQTNANIQAKANLIWEIADPSGGAVQAPRVRQGHSPLNRTEAF